MDTLGLRVAGLALVVLASPASATVDEPRAATVDVGAPAASLPDRAVATTIYGETPELEATAHQVLQLFAELGFELPIALDVLVYESADPCRRPDGSYRAGVMIVFPERYEVRSCGTVATLIHEVAHVWEHSSFDDSRRAAFLKLRGLDSWGNEVWSAAGGEHLASVIAWGLTGVRPTMVSPADDVSLAEAYELATGAAAPTLAERGLALVNGRVRRAA